jgi:hypothetical protein
MTIGLVRDQNFTVDFKKLKALIEKKCSYIKIQLVDNNYYFEEKLIVYNKTHKKHLEILKPKIKSDFTILGTEVPYNNNYFFEAYDNFLPISFYGWRELTDLPKENGMLYWICDQALSFVQPKNYVRHSKTTGCLNDFLSDKTGIDVGMRQANLCKKCYSDLMKKKLTKNEEYLFADIKILLNFLSEQSKWENSVFDKPIVPKLQTNTKNSTLKKPKTTSILKEKKGIKENKKIKILIASPSDTEQEREVLKWKLAEKFRMKGYEEQTGFRLIVEGWESMPPQQGNAQEVINRLLLSQVNIVLGVLRHKIGTPTAKAISGTAEEILYALKGNPKELLGMVYFYSKKPRITVGDPGTNSVISQWKALEKFKKEVQSLAVYKPYSSFDDLLENVVDDVANNIKQYFG